MQLLGAKSLSMGRQGLLKLCIRERCVCIQNMLHSDRCTIFSMIHFNALPESDNDNFEGLDAHPSIPVFTCVEFSFCRKIDALYLINFFSIPCPCLTIVRLCMDKIQQRVFDFYFFRVSVLALLDVSIN